MINKIPIAPGSFGHVSVVHLGSRGGALGSFHVQLSFNHRETLCFPSSSSSWGDQGWHLRLPYLEEGMEKMALSHTRIEPARAQGLG